MSTLHRFLSAPAEKQSSAALIANLNATIVAARAAIGENDAKLAALQSSVREANQAHYAEMREAETLIRVLTECDQFPHMMSHLTNLLSSVQHASSAAATESRADGSNDSSSTAVSGTASSGADSGANTAVPTNSDKK